MNPYFPNVPRLKHEISTPKTEWKKYRPDRYLYHLSEGGILEKKEEDLFFKRLNIAFTGLWGKEKGTGGVWANNQIDKSNHLWPICYDSWGLSEKECMDLYYQYDVWRIDTHAIPNKWYLDPNLIYSPAERPGSASDYLYTEFTVPPVALKLFTITLREYGYLLNEFKCKISLVPVDNINDIIYHKWKKNKYPLDNKEDNTNNNWKKKQW